MEDSFFLHVTYANKILTNSGVVVYTAVLLFPDNRLVQSSVYTEDDSKEDARGVFNEILSNAYALTYYNERGNIG